MTVEEIKKYAIEKGLPSKTVDALVQRLREDFPDGLDDMRGRVFLAEIDREAEFWTGVRSFLDWSREVREERKNRKNK